MGEMLLMLPPSARGVWGPLLNSCLCNFLFLKRFKDHPSRTGSKMTMKGVSGPDYQGKVAVQKHEKLLWSLFFKNNKKVNYWQHYKGVENEGKIATNSFCLCDILYIWFTELTSKDHLLFAVLHFYLTLNRKQFPRCSTFFLLSF